MKQNLNGYLRAVMKRLETPKIKQTLMFAKCDPAKVNAPLTDEKGLKYTMDAILTAASNMYTSCKGRDAVAEMVTNFSDNGFSDGIGYSDVSNVNTIGAIDVTLTARADSLIPYVCADRALPTPAATVYFQNLVALTDNGDIKAGDVVNGSYLPPNPYVTLDLAGSDVTNEADMDADTTGNQALLGGPVVPGTVAVAVDFGSSTEKFVGKDFNRDGIIYFAGQGITATVDYKTGVVTFDKLASASAKVTFTAKLDSNKSEVGNGILRVGPEYKNIQLESIPQNIILENNMLSQAYMDKTYTLASGSTASPYNDQLFNRIKATYTEYLNRKVLIPMIANTQVADSAMDLSAYALNDFAYTKNDMIAQCISNMMAAMLARTGVGVTCIVTNSYGASLLMNVPNLFVASPEASKNINSVIGYWQGIPVFRHNYLDIAYGDASNKAQFIGCYKASDNSAASTIYGEFLPFTSTGLVGNFLNPTQVANGYFSQVGVAVVSPQLFTRTEILLPNIVGSGSDIAFPVPGSMTPSWRI